MSRIVLISIAVVLNICSSSLIAQEEDFLDRQRITSIVLLPPVGESVPSSARRLSADLFMTNLKVRRASCRLVGPEEALGRIERAGLLSDFTGLVNLLSQTGVVNREVLRRIGTAAETDAVLLINVLDYQEEKGSWWYGKGGRNLGRIQYTLFATSTGEKVWESLEFRQHDSKLSTRPYPMDRVIGDISEKAVASLLTGRQNRDVRKRDAD